MDNITQRSMFDSEIKAAAAQLQELVTNNASHTDIAMAESRLRELVAARREHLYDPKDPSYYIDKVFAGASFEDRRKAAEELEGPVTEALVEFLKEDTKIQEGEFLNYDLLNDVLAFLRFFKNRKLEDSAQGYMESKEQEYPRLVWGNKPGLTLHRFCEELVQRKFIGLPDASLLEAVLEDYKSTIRHHPPIDWDGTNESITTFFIVCQYLGILNPDTAPSRSRVLLDDSFGQYRLPVPPAASIISDCFTVRGSHLSTSTISRNLAGEIILELETIRDRVERFYVDFKLGERTPENLTWDDILCSLFILLDEPAMNRKDLIEAINLVDFEILKFLNDLLGDCGPDRHEATTRLANLP